MKTISSQNIGVDILINGNKTKIHSNAGKFFLEARNGTKYSINIKIEDNSYVSERQDAAAQNGVIGIEVFEEQDKYVPKPSRPYYHNKPYTGMEM